jgi:hypothetical protein
MNWIWGMCVRGPQLCVPITFNMMYDITVCLSAYNSLHILNRIIIAVDSVKVLVNKWCQFPCKLLQRAAVILVFVILCRTLHRHLEILILSFL